MDRNLFSRKSFWIDFFWIEVLSFPEIIFWIEILSFPENYFSRNLFSRNHILSRKSFWIEIISFYFAEFWTEILSFPENCFLDRNYFPEYLGPRDRERGILDELDGQFDHL